MGEQVEKRHTCSTRGPSEVPLRPFGAAVCRDRPLSRCGGGLVGALLAELDDRVPEGGEESLRIDGDLAGDPVAFVRCRFSLDESAEASIPDGEDRPEVVLCR